MGRAPAPREAQRWADGPWNQAMAVDYCCPRYHEPLDLLNSGMLVGKQHGIAYPVVGGIPILLADEDARRQIAQTDWSAGATGGASAIGFYNRTKGQDAYFRADLQEARADIERWLGQAAVDGPVLEIGSGYGALQGICTAYVALDYSLTALQKYVQPGHQRVCGSAAHLPFLPETFRLVFTLHTLEHVPEAGRAFAEVDRVLKPGGIAYLLPAWHCVPYNCAGIPVRPYKDLAWRQKLTKLTLPVRRHVVAKALWALPGRLLRRVLWSLRGGPTDLRWQRLRPEYERFWMADSDAVSRLDSHEACLFFHSRGYEILRPGPRVIRQLLAKHEPVVVRKPLGVHK